MHRPEVLLTKRAFGLTGEEVKTSAGAAASSLCSLQQDDILQPQPFLPFQDEARLWPEVVRASRLPHLPGALNR